MKKKLAILMVIFLCAQTCFWASAEETDEISAEAAVLMEAETGKILYEKNADQALPPASVTKIMTLLLIFEALEEGTISLEEEVVTSEYASSMGGSQVYLEAGEVQTVDALIKCIAVASANDAAAAMAEKVAGTSEQFVQQMNEKAKELGMEATNFVNCNGLDAEGHLTSARDIALMSRELILNYPQVFEYTKIWTDTITHSTSKGTSEFGLTNTNKWIRQYEYATGLKTGYTSTAKYCLSATAQKDGVQMIAVVMGEPDSKTRNKDVTWLLNYGFGKCNIYVDEKILNETIYAEVQKGKSKQVEGVCKESFRYVDFSDKDLSGIEKTISVKKVKAPVMQGACIGEVIYTLEQETLGKVAILAKYTVQEQSFADTVCEILEKAAAF